jgi:hypothetical protein
MKRFVVFVILLFVAFSGAKAYDFSVNNSDGKEIAYSITSANTVEVARKTFEWQGGTYSIYKGVINIPSTVSYSGTTYTVTAIGDTAFFLAEEMTAVTLPNTITRIGNGGFSYCHIQSMVIPQAVTYIGQNAFFGCSITVIDVPSNVTYIGNAFVHLCSSLTDINVDSNNPKYSSVEGILYNKQRDTLICCPEGKLDTIVLPNNVRCIDVEAFEYSKLTSLIMSNTIQTISPYAFVAAKMSNITLSNSLTRIDRSAFCRNSKLHTITLPASLDTIDEGNFDYCDIYIQMHGFDSIVSWAVTPPVCTHLASSYPDTLFCNVDRSIPVYVPCGSIPLYQAADVWNEFTNYKELPYKCIDTINDSFCQGDSYNFNGTEIRIAGIYQDTLQTAQGCDSIVVLKLTQNPSYNDTMNVNVCNASYDFNGRILTTDGLYTDTLSSVFGCDSVVTINLHFSSEFIDTITTHICAGETYSEHGFSATESGTYQSRVAGENGCDSIYTLHLTVFEHFSDTVEACICRGETYTQYGFSEKEEGTFTKVYQDTNGCDSTYILNLKVIKLMIPNAVTPNGDGINDIFEIHDLLNQTYYTQNELWLYSRQGKLLYHKQDIQTEADFWDPKKTSSPNGTYYYRFIANNPKTAKKIELNGSVEVLGQ